MMRSLLVLTALAAGALSAPGAAHAATVISAYDPGGPGKGQFPYYQIGFDAGPGESNAVSVRADGDALVIEDRGASVSASGLCASADVHTVRCPLAHAGLRPSLAVYLRDGDDSGTVAPGAVSVQFDGGDGNDLLTGSSLAGGAGDDTLTGTAGGDFLLSPGPGTDVVLAGAGDDYVEAGDATAPGDDRIDAGEGADTVRYGEVGPGATGVTIDLAAGTARGGAQGLDVLAGVEHAAGGAGRDTLVGDAGANRLSGMGGRDRLVGGDGADRLAGGAGRDAIDGGEGDDLLIAGGDSVGPVPGYDTFACGGGHDAIKFAFRRDVVGADCEALDNTGYPEDGRGIGFDPHPRAVGSNRLVFRVPCAEGRCRIDVTVAVDGKRIARGRRAGAGRVRVPVALDRRARRAVRAADGRVQVTVALGNGFGYAYSVTLR